LSTPPPEIVRSGKETIISYFKQLKEQKEDYLFEAKMLIVGEPGAGKTTMARKIENPDNTLPRENETTKGIDVKQYLFSLKKEDFPAYKDFEKLENIGFRLNLWDFGGQEIYKATHRFFSLSAHYMHWLPTAATRTLILIIGCTSLKCLAVKAH
jgi:GTPase SAR1 family protein